MNSRNIVKDSPANSQFDRILAIVVFVLMIFGVVMVSSASAINSFFNTDGQSTQYYFWNQFYSLIVALVAWFIVQKVPYRFWYKHRMWVLGVALVLLGTIFTPLRSNANTFARGWINIPLLPSIQPSEITKTAFIIYLASFFDGLGPKVRSLKDGFFPFLIIVGVFLLFLMAEPDFGSVLLYTCIAICMFFIAQGNMMQMTIAGLIGGTLFASIISKKKYIVDRFTAFLNPDADPTGIGYQIKQALIAVGSGGFWGYGFGNSRQKFAYLPEAQGDAIFAIASEELGFIRVTFVILGFAVIAWRGMKIAEKAPDRFGKYLATGITCWICLEAFINIGVIMGILPNTGLTLPFISHGGSSLLSKAVAVGILLNISRHTNETSNYRRGNWGAHPTFNRHRLSPKSKGSKIVRNFMARFSKRDGVSGQPKKRRSFP